MRIDFQKIFASLPADRRPNSPVRVVGVRGANDNPGQQNSFAHYDDQIFVEIDGVQTAWLASTDPAWALVVHPIVSSGAAQLCEGTHLFGPVLMHGKYPCFGQAENVHVNRLDANGNVKYTESGFFGIDLHSGGEGMDTGRFSAGCQIIQNKDGYFQNPFWNSFYQPLHDALKRHGLSVFPYHLTTLAALQAMGAVS